jgi:hypothetical protein
MPSAAAGPALRVVRARTRGQGRDADRGEHPEAAAPAPGRFPVPRRFISWAPAPAAPSRCRRVKLTQGPFLFGPISRARKLAGARLGYPRETHCKNLRWHRRYNVRLTGPRALKIVNVTPPFGREPLASGSVAARRIIVVPDHAIACQVTVIMSRPIHQNGRLGPEAPPRPERAGWPRRAEEPADLGRSRGRAIWRRKPGSACLPAGPARLAR